MGEGIVQNKDINKSFQVLTYKHKESFCFLYYGEALKRKMRQEG